jgi:hypothetical protein
LSIFENVRDPNNFVVPGGPLSSFLSNFVKIVCRVLQNSLNESVDDKLSNNQKQRIVNFFSNSWRFFFRIPKFFDLVIWPYRYVPYIPVFEIVQEGEFLIYSFLQTLKLNRR